MKKPRFPRRTRWRVLLLVVLPGVIWIGVLGYTAWGARGHLAELRASLRGGQRGSADARNLCATVDRSHSDLNRLSWLLIPAKPLLPHLGFLPRYGDRLASLPETLDFGRAALDFGQHVCRAAHPALPALDRPAEERARVALEQLAVTPPDWAALEQSAAQLSQRWQALPPQALTHGWLAPYASQLQAAGPGLVELPFAVRTARRILPAADALLGLSAPRRFLILGQNPFEIRATGGFIGSLGLVTVEQGKLKSLEYGDSAELDVPAPPNSDTPLPYKRYLRASQWYMRDANWWADFPTSASTLEAFWSINGRDEPLDGVIAFDLYAVRELMQMFGEITVPGYGPIKAEGTFEDIFGYYEAQGARARQDKQFISALVRELAALIQQAPPARIPHLLIATGHALEERHISLALHDEAAAATLQAAGWDGALRQDAGDYLQVVDSDLSYGDVQAFIDEQIDYAVELDSSMAPLTATVTVTLTNHYDPWRAALTAERVYGYCLRPGTEILEHMPGCYGDYIRFYLPTASAPLELTGADSPPTADEEAGRAVLGAYLLLYPGETRSLQLRYRHHLPPGSASYTLTAQKQAGTLARPLTIRIRRGEDQLVVATDLWQDRQIVAGLTEGRLQLLSGPGPLHPSTTPEKGRQIAATEQGKLAWARGDTEGALQIWRAGQALDWALDWARGLMMRGQLDQARLLADALISEPMIAARAAYLRGDLALRSGQTEAAKAAYGQSLAADPTNDAPHFALAVLLQQEGNVDGALAQLNQMQDPRAELRYLATNQIGVGNRAGAEKTLALLLALAPDDRHAQDLLRTGYGASDPPDWQAIYTLSTAVLQQRPQDTRWLLERAQAAEKLNNLASALQDYEAVTVISPTNRPVWESVARLRVEANQDQAGGLAAYATIREIDPRAAIGYTGAAGILIEQQKLAEAEAVLREGIAAQTDVPMPGYVLGNLLIHQGRLDEAVALLELAAQRSNDTGSHYYAALGNGYRALNQRELAEAAYRRALAINPADQVAAQGLAALGVNP